MATPGKTKTGIGSLADRNRIAILVRWAMVACIAVLALAMRAVTGWPADARPVGLILAALVAANLAYEAHLSRVVARGPFRRSVLFIQWQALADLALLALLTHYTGGVESPFLYAPVVVLLMAGSLARTRRATVALAALAVLLTADLVAMSELRLIGYHGPAAQPLFDDARLRQVAASLTGFTLLAAVAAGGSIALTSAMRRRATDLSNAARRYREMLEAGGDLVFSADGDGRVTFASPGLEVVTGFSLPELVGRDARGGLFAPSSAEAAAAAERVLATGEASGPLEAAWVTRDGRTLTMETELQPLRQGGRIVGLHGIARDVTRQKQAAGDLERRLAEVGRLYQASAQLKASLNLEETLQAVARAAVEATGGSAACVILMDAAGGPEMRVATGAMASVPLERIMRPHGISSRVAATGEPAVFPDLAQAAGANPGLLSSGLKAALCLPLRSAEHSIGVLWLAWAERREISSGSVELLQAFAEQIAASIETARAFARERRRGRLLETVSAIGRQMAAPLDLDVMLDRAARTLHERLGYPAASIMTLDEKKRVLVPRALATSYSERKNGYAGQPVGTGIVGRAASEGASIVVADVATDPRYTMLFPDTRSELALPLKFGNTVLGVLNLESDEAGAFAPDDVAVLEILADQLAVALHNARLFHEVAGRAHATGVIHQATVEMSAAASCDQVLEITLRTAMSLADAEECAVYLVSPGNSHYEEVVLDGDGRLVRSFHHRVRRGVGLTGVIERERRPVVVEDAGEAAEDGGRDRALARLYASAGVPMVAGGQAAGVLFATRYNKPAFLPQQTESLSILANAAAVALANARLQADRERALAELSALNQIAQAINSVLESDQVLTVIREQVGRLIENDNFYIALYNEAESTVTFPLAYEDGHRKDWPARSGGNGVTEYVIHTRAPLLVRGDLRGALAARDINMLVNGWEPSSWLGVPLMVRDHVVGVMAVQSRQSDRFDESHQQVLMSVGAQAAIALEKARLYQDLTDQARRDSLTQVYNHGYFLECLDALVNEGATPLSLIMLDIDHFKKYNDRYGHVSGDLVLKAIVQAIRDNIHKEDVVGRWGGEEFGILLARTGAAGARVVAERIRETLSTTPLSDATGQAVLKPTVSQGIATYPDIASSGEELVGRADASLYWAKAAGRDQILVAGSDSETAALAAVDEGRI